MLDVHPPGQAFTKLHTVTGKQVAKTECAWCELPYETADVVPWRDLAGIYEGTKMFHEECWGDALRSLRAKFEVAQQLGLTPREVV